jgi:hypothetical protein
VHESDLVKASRKEKTTECDQGFVGEVSSAIIIVAPLGIGTTQSCHVIVPPPGKTTADVPEAIAVQRQALKTGISVEPGHTTIAVEEGVDPHQSMMRRCGSDKRHDSVMFTG